MQPRNTLVEVELIEGEKDAKVGGIIIAGTPEMYCEGYVRSIGPGSLDAEGGRSLTHDLEVGQRVLVKRYEVRQTGQGIMKNEAGIRFVRHGKTFILFEQMSVVAILEQPDIRPLPAQYPYPAAFQL